MEQESLLLRLVRRIHRTSLADGAGTFGQFVPDFGMLLVRYSFSLVPTRKLY